MDFSLIPMAISILQALGDPEEIGENISGKQLDTYAIVEFALLDGTIGALQRRADFVSPLMHQFIFPAGFSSPQKYWSLEELSLMISAMRHLAYVSSRFSLMFSPLSSGSPSA